MVEVTTKFKTLMTRDVDDVDALVEALQTGDVSHLDGPRCNMNL